MVLKADYGSKTNEAVAANRICMPFGRYRGEPVYSIRDGRELRKWLSWPFIEFLSDKEYRAIELAYVMADHSEEDGTESEPTIEFVDQCRALSASLAESRRNGK